MILSTHYIIKSNSKTYLSRTEIMLLVRSKLQPYKIDQLINFYSATFIMPRVSANKVEPDLKLERSVRSMREQSKGIGQVKQVMS